MKFFDKNLPIKSACDASKLGLAAMLEQLHGSVWYPTGFASRLLTAAEQNYSQIEKERLSIVFSCEKFHEYVYGLRFVVENDHKPLISIFQRALSKSPPPSFSATIATLQLPTQICPWKSTIRCGHA